MNYLAHLFLSGDDPLLRLGNLAGDFIKGCDTGLLHPRIQQGIILHHAIDRFTDRHDTVRRSKGRISPKLTRLSGMLIDIFYDHFLALDWDGYTPVTLEEFSAGVYTDLERYSNLLPPRLKELAPRIIAGNWLPGYRSTEMIDGAVTRLGQRLRNRINLGNGIDELHNNAESLKADFQEFFPQVIRFSQETRRKLRLP